MLNRTQRRHRAQTSASSRRWPRRQSEKCTGVDIAGLERAIPVSGDPLTVTSNMGAMRRRREQLSSERTSGD